MLWKTPPRFCKKFIPASHPASQPASCQKHPPSHFQIFIIFLKEFNKQNALENAAPILQKIHPSQPPSQPASQLPKALPPLKDDCRQINVSHCAAFRFSSVQVSALPGASLELHFCCLSLIFALPKPGCSNYSCDLHRRASSKPICIQK